MHAYSELYVSDAQKRLGSMLDFAVNGSGCDLAQFYQGFLQSGLAKRFGFGEPSIVAGHSGIELALEVLESMAFTIRPSENLYQIARSFTPIAGASREYWTGWALAYYQWESGRSFASTQSLVPIEQIQGLYSPYHEMDITSFCERVDALCLQAQPHTNLAVKRKRAGLSQNELAQASGIPVRTLQQYEQRQKDINKAQAQYIIQLARVLHCSPEDLLEYSSAPHYEYATTSI